MDPRDRLTKARVAVEAGDYETALGEYVWFHDHALEYRPSLYGVRLSFALSYWKDLGDLYPPAMLALRNMGRDKTARLFSGEEDRNLFHDVASINEYLGEGRSTYELFRTLDQTAPAFARQCFRLAVDAIVAAKDFELAARYAPDPESALLELSDDLNNDVADHRAGPPVKAPRLNAYIHIYCGRIRNLLRILAGTGRPLDAGIAKEWAVALVEDRRARDRVRTALYSNNDA